MDYEAERRHILSAVAEGDLSPSEAAERLAVLEEARSTDTSSGGTWRGPGTGSSDDRGDDTPVGEVARVRVVGSLRSIDVVGDPSVREAVASGPHHAYRRGDVLVIETESPDWGGFDGETLGFRFEGRSTRRIVTNFRRQVPQPPVKIRVNPSLPLDAELSAGSMTVTDVAGPIRAEVSAGTMRVRNFMGPIDIQVSAGAFTGNGIINDGVSRIECSAGKVDLVLDPGSSVCIAGNASLGKIALPNSPGTRGGLGAVRSDAEVGAGAGSLEIEVSLGSVSVREATSSTTWTHR